METMAFLGCSKGLGRQFCQDMNAAELCSFSLLAARSTDLLNSLSESLNHPNQILTLDFSKEESLEPLLSGLQSKQVQRVFYFAGGGPYGKFQNKNWKDHQWALNVNFLTPAKLLHSLLSSEHLSSLKQIVLIGSQIADDKGDPMAASYSMSKHGLRGLVESLLGENPPFDLRLFRPGYLDTALLPKNASPRHNPEALMALPQASQFFMEWVMDPSGAKIWGPEA